MGFEFGKGHGTGNDFVLLPDDAGDVHGDLDPALVSRLCDRRAGIGADGVLRVIRTAALDDPADRVLGGSAEWFMDHRNADGSRSQMCGNGIRLFARYLAESGLVEATAPVRVGTRHGVKVVTFNDDDTTTVDMGTPVVVGETRISAGQRSWVAVNVGMGNPHAVTFVDSIEDAGSLREPPGFDGDDYPDGVNVEFVERVAERHLVMRVFERGVGETRSCGTGACAVMVAAARADGSELPSTYRVDVPGGRLGVTWHRDGHVELTGPAVLVAVGTWLG